MKRKSTENNHIVYIHRNKINGKVYVGQTYNLHERWRCNGKNYFNSIKFYNAILKYGWDNFTHEIILNNSKSCLININGEIGSLRYWANKVKSNHVVLSYRLKKYGVSNLIEWIKKRRTSVV